MFRTLDSFFGEVVHSDSVPEYAGYSICGANDSGGVHALSPVLRGAVSQERQLPMRLFCAYTTQRRIMRSGLHRLGHEDTDILWIGRIKEGISNRSVSDGIREQLDELRQIASWDQESKEEAKHVRKPQAHIGQRHVDTD